LYKYTFHADIIEHLGYISSPTGLTTDPAKVQTILDGPETHKVEGVLSSLDFATSMATSLTNTPTS
jgi:hypothetical protein